MCYMEISPVQYGSGPVEYGSGAVQYGSGPVEYGSGPGQYGSGLGQYGSGPVHYIIFRSRTHIMIPHRRYPWPVTYDLCYDDVVS